MLAMDSNEIKNDSINSIPIDFSAYLYLVFKPLLLNKNLQEEIKSW
jgi:hypothetical protein